MILIYEGRFLLRIIRVANCLAIMTFSLLLLFDLDNLLVLISTFNFLPY